MNNRTGYKTFLPLRHCTYAIPALLALLCAVPTGRADLPDDKNTRNSVVGQPMNLNVHPAKLVFKNANSYQQLIVTGTYADGVVRDLTHFCDASIAKPQMLDISEGLYLKPKADGETVLTIHAGGKSIAVPVVVSNVTQAREMSFRHDFIAALNVGGCNSGACHGTPSGKNGFKLSLRGYDPPADYIELTRDVLGRRTNRLSPDKSLILQKGLGKIAHEGGQRFPATSIPAQVMQAWLAEGMQNDDAKLPKLTRIEVIPGERQLKQPSRWQQLAVLGHFSDGGVRDVTRLTVFTSSDAALADVNRLGLVEFSQAGEVAILCRYLDELISVRFTYLEPKKDFVWSNPPTNNYIDKHIFTKLKMLNIQPSGLCTDQEFLRRAYMDLCGVLPTAKEAQEFLNDNDPKKREKLLDTLLDRPEYADFWTLKWADVFRSTRKKIQVKGTHAFQKWLRSNIAKNTSLDKMVRDVLTASGSTFSNPPANYYRIASNPSDLAETTAQLFFGIRMQCAKCHNHPFERWTQDDYYSFSAFFARVKSRKDPLQPGKDRRNPGAEYIYTARAGEVVQPRTGKPVAPKFLGDEIPSIPLGTDRRVVLAKWLTSPSNSLFGKSIVNRIWYHVVGRGIVDPVDDFRDSNPSANDPLLDELAQDFAKHNFDVKYLIRTIMSSRTYQLSAETNGFNSDDEKYFSHAVTKLHTAEQLFDALCQVTAVPEKFAGLPAGTRAAQLPDGEYNHPFLKTFGQPARELACECERESDSNLAQALQLINGPAVNDRLRNANNLIGKLLVKKMPNSQILNHLFLTTLSRTPTTQEENTMLNHVTESANARQAWEDVHWALINSKEFLFRH